MRLKENLSLSSGLSIYHPRYRKLGLRSPLNAYSGYGVHGSYTARWLLKLGYDVRLQPLSTDSTCFEDVSDRISQPPCPKPSLLIAPPGTKVEEHEWFFTMHETTQMPPEMFENVRRAEAVIVPSNWCQQCFNAQGIDAPIYVVPIGVNTAIFRPVTRRRQSLVVLGSAGNLLMSGPQRKNFDLLLTAFAEAFRSDNDVRLRLKIRPECPVPAVTDSRVEIIREQMSELELADWFRSLTAYVSTSRCEAFGQMNLQAMACGVPVVCCAFGGVLDYHSDDVGYSVAFRLSQPNEGYYNTGVWAEPELDSLIQQMRRVYEDAALLERKASKAVDVAHKYTWNSAILKLDTVLKLGGFWSDQRRPRRPRPAVPAPAAVPAVSPAFNGQVKFKSVWHNEKVPPRKKLPLWLARRTGGAEPTFYMSGDLGDIVYALPTIRAFGGGQLCVGPAQTHPYYMIREQMTPVRYAALAPLLQRQRYLTRVYWSDEMLGWRCHVDLNDSRRLHREPYYVVTRNLADVASCYFGLGPGLWRDKWLEAEPKRVARFVFARSERYHTKFPWKQIVQKHAANAVFIGTAKEHQDFVAELGPVAYYPTTDLYEAAQVIAGADWVVANQSCPLAVAEGLKANIVRENYAPAANCIFNREGHTDDARLVLDLC